MIDLSSLTFEVNPFFLFLPDFSAKLRTSMKPSKNHMFHALLKKTVSSWITPPIFLYFAKSRKPTPFRITNA